MVLDLPRYVGTIMKRNINGQDEVFARNGTLIYDDKYDEYLLVAAGGYNYFYDYVDAVLATWEKNDDESFQKLEKYFLKTSIPNEDGKLYVDESSLVLLKKKSDRR